MNLLTKEILNQYADIREETKDLSKRIASLEEQLRIFENQKTVVDVVKGGEGGNRLYVIEGLPYPQYSRKKSLLLSRKLSLEALQLELLEKTNSAESFINGLNDARMRRILKLRFLDNLTWIQVAHKMGGYHTEDSCRKAVERFFKAK